MPDGSAKVQPAPKGAETLSERELDVLRLLAAGESYKEIGQKLFLSLNTVQFHVKSIYRKLAVNKRMGAIEKARERKLI
ncbi:MAG: helix-turn-helix transcriptional regulator [Chloroflexi bacterium]|nr:helix-turn-helix transcriptional regulator [Chloroflexota bacterium]MDL1920576.1 response regulator transcription factor [Chloroflexi bacterium CFX5]RIK52134.1 MAG: helix-turn-helix transcriptional regulator [Chloroflexota bacterium]